MPAIQTYYANQEEYLLDKARENPFFDEKSYESGGFDYLATLELATYGENKNVDFNTYNILPSDQKMNYLAYSLGYVDDPNITGDYFNAVAEDYQKQLEWDNKNWFEKLGESVSTTIKSAATEVYGIVEGFVDTLAQVGASIGELVGADVSGIKEFIASDFSGVGEFRQQIQEEVRYNKWINQGFGKYVFDAFTSLGSMSALTLNLIAPGLGTGVYYSNVFGKSAEEVYSTRGTSISSWEATSYAGLQTGAEYIGEKIFSSKFLGGMINTSAWKAKSRVINIALSALEEGTEEIVTEALNYATNSLYSSVVSSDYEQFLPENGLGRAMLDSFITGALMGGITTGVGSVLTKRITLPNGVKLNKNQSYLWKELSEDIREASVKNSALYDLRLKKGTNYTQAEYDAAYKKDVKAMKAAARALKVVGGLETTFGTSNMSEIKSNLTQETYLRDARNAVRNYWIEYSNPEYKRLIDNTSVEYNKYAEEFNSKNKNTRLTVVNETSEEFQLIESAFSGIGKKVIPVKVGNSSGAVGQAFIEGSSVGQSGVIYIDVDKLGRLSPDQILEKSIAEYGVNLLAKNNSIINDSAIKELFDRPSGKELTQAEKNLIAYNLLSNPKTISAVVGCNKRLAKKIIDNLKNRLKIESGKTKYSKITINQLNKTLLLYKYQLATNAGTKEGVAYYSKEYDLDEIEMLKIFNSLNEYDFQQHYVSEKLDVSVTSKTRTDALNLLNNARLASEIQNENVISDYSELLNENIYKPDFVKQIKQDSRYENFAYALNTMLYDNFGLYINSNTGTFEVARNVVREIDPEFRLKMDEYSNRLYNLKQSELSDSEYTNELNNIVDEINSNKYTIRDFYNGAFLKHIKLDKNTPIIFEINDDVSYDASYNPATNIIKVYINSFDYKPGVGAIKGLNSELNDVKSNIYNSIIHESVHVLAESKNSYFGTNIRGIVGFFNTEKGTIIYNKLKKLLESRFGSLDKSMMANLVYNLTYGEMEASRYSKSTPSWIRSFMETIGYSPELGTAMVSDGFLATKDGKLIGKGKFLGIIIDLTDSTYAAHEVSFDALSEEGVSKESKETEESQLSIDNTEDIIDKERRLKELIKDYSSNKNRTKETYIEIGRLSDELGIDLPGYNYETYDRLVAEQKETEQKSEYKIVKKETLSDEEKFNNYKARVALIRELAKQNNTEELSKLQNRYEKNDKRLLINEMGKELYNKLISEFNKLEGVSTKSALNEQALNVRKSIEKHIDKLTPENKAIFEELRYKWGGKGETKKMSQEDVENRLKTLEKIRNQFKTKPYNQKEEGRKIFVNESGEYNTFYKGASISGITEFDNTKGDKKRIVEGAVYLTDSRDVALTYTQSDEGAVYSVNIKATNPYIIDAKGRTFEKIIADKSTDNFVLDIKQRGYDSVIIKNVVDVGARYVGNTAEARKPHTDIVVFNKSDVEIISSEQAKPEVKIEQKTEKSDKKSETRGVFDKSDEQILVGKKQLSSQISDIMTNLSDTTYRNEGAFEGDLRAGTKTSKSKMSQGSEYAIASQALFFEKKSDWLSAINKKNASEILSQLETTEMNALNKRFILNYLWINRYKLNKSQINELNSMIEVENTRVGQEMVAIKNALEEDSPISALASDIKTEYGVSIKVSDDVVAKYIPEVKELGWEKALEKTTKEIDDLKKKLSETEDALSKYDLEEQIKDKQKLANLLSEQDGVGLMSYAYDKLLNPNYDYTEGKIKASELSNEILQIMIEQTEGLKKLLTPKKDGKPGSMFSPQTQEKILNFFNKARSFRYLCMLSSFSTAARNALTNTAIGINKILEDRIGKGLEKVVMKNAPESQVSYYGDYDKAFSDFIDDTYEEYVRSRSGTDTKWKQTEGGEIKKQFTQEKNKFKLAPLNWFAKTERKLLSDAPWTVRRTLKNFKSMISGALPQLKVDVYNILAAKYNVNSQEALLNKLKSGNKEAYDQFVAMTNNDLIATTKLAMRLQVPLLEQVLRKAEYRADRLYFRTDNPISRGLDNLRKNHPIVHDIISFFIPFGKVMYNTTAYAVEHSPIGLAMGVVKQLQTRNSWVSDMRHEIQTYVNSLYYTQTNKTDYNSEEYNNWVSKNISEELKNVLSGSNKNAANIYNKLVDEGKILSGIIGLNNPFAKADVIELYSKGAIGTAYLVLGIVLALTGAFKIDDDDYMGLILKIGNVKIRLSDLAPFSTAFSFGAALIGASEGKFGTGLKNALSTFYDQTMLGTVESIIGYNDSITNILQYQGIQALQQYIPSILKQFTKVIDPHAKKKSGNFWDKLWQTTASNIPGLSYLVPNKVDPYTGESEQRYSTGAIGELIHIFNPLKIVVEKKSDLEVEAERVGATTTGTSGTFSINGTKYTLYGKELETYSKIRADYVKNEMNKLINSLYYKRLSKEEQSKEIKKIYDAAGEIMKINYWLNSGHSSYVFTDYSKMNDYSNYIESSKIQYRKKWNKSKYID